MTNLEFARKSKTGGPWDLKHKNNWDLDRHRICLFNGIRLTYQDPGNINYGYVGSVIHTLTDLHMFAGEYQICSGTSNTEYWRTFFDDPDAYYAVSYGYMLKNGGLFVP